MLRALIKKIEYTYTYLMESLRLFRDSINSAIVGLLHTLISLEIKWPTTRAASTHKMAAVQTDESILNKDSDIAMHIDHNEENEVNHDDSLRAMETNEQLSKNGMSDGEDVRSESPSEEDLHHVQERVLHPTTSWQRMFIRWMPIIFVVGLGAVVAATGKQMNAIDGDVDPIDAATLSESMGTSDLISASENNSIGHKAIGRIFSGLVEKVSRGLNNIAHDLAEEANSSYYL